MPNTQEDNSNNMHKSFVLQMQKDAIAADYDTRCIACKQIVVYWENNEALAPGHIYSKAGLDEYLISQMCEWCFDICTEPIVYEED